jgi:hypothetical protein
MAIRKFLSCGRDRGGSDKMSVTKYDATKVVTFLWHTRNKYVFIHLFYD